MTGTHRGERNSGWQLLAAVAASLLGRGYAGRHRTADAVLDRPTSQRPAVAHPAAVTNPAVGRPAAPAVARASAPAPARPVVVPRLTLVPAGTSPFPAHRA